MPQNQLNEGFLELYQQIRQSSPRLFFDAQKITTLIAKASSKGYSAEKTWPYLKRLEELLGRREGYKRPSEHIIGLFLFAKLTRTEERKNALKFYRDVLEAGRTRMEVTDLIKEYVEQEVASKLAPAKKGEDVDVETTSKMAKDISPDVLGLVKNIYDPMGGMPGADSATGVLTRFTNFLVSDVDEDPEPDSGILYTNWGGSKKASAIVNDGGPESKVKTRELMADFFSKPGAWCEVSGAPANIAIAKLGIPAVENEAEVRALMPAIKDIVWHGEHPRGVPYGKGWYTRNIAGHAVTKIIIGNPPNRGTLKEYIEELARAEAEDDDLYGKYLFAPDRLDLEPAAKKEENTDEEDDLLVALYNHYSNNEFDLGGLAPHVLKLIKQGKYENILAPPADTSVYRFVGPVLLSVASSILRVPEKSIFKEPNIIKHSGPGRMKPGGNLAGKTGIHSWSIKLEVDWLHGDIVGHNQAHDDAVYMVLVGNTNAGAFFVNPVGIENVEGLPDYAYRQNEVISYGTIPFERAVYYYCDNDRSGKFVQMKQLIGALIEAAK